MEGEGRRGGESKITVSMDISESTNTSTIVCVYENAIRLVVRN